MGGEQEGSVPVEALPPAVARRHDASSRAGAQVEAHDGAVLALAVHHVRIGGIDRAVEAVASVDLDPVAHPDAAAPGGAGTAPAPVVLQAAVHPIRRARVHGHVVELADAEHVEVVPDLAAVPARVQAAVAPEKDAVRPKGVDPQGVVVGVDRAGDRLEALAAVEGAVHRDAQDPHLLLVGGVHPHLAVVEGPRVDAVHALPGRAAVLGAEHAAALEAVLPLLVLCVGHLPSL